MVERYTPQVKLKVSRFVPQAERKRRDRMRAREWTSFASYANRKDTSVNPFVMPEFPAAAIPPPHRGTGTRPTMAMDSNISSISDWASASVIQGSFQDGVQFLGYPYLSALAQRGEHRVIVETIAGEMTRKWGKFEATGDDEKIDRINQLEEEFERLHIEAKFRSVSEMDGYFGRAHLFFDFGQQDGEELRSPIGNGKNATSKAKVGPGERTTTQPGIINRNAGRGVRIQRLTPVEPVWTYPTTYESINPLKPDWYNPTQWYVMGQEIHATRIPKFVAREVPDLLKAAYSFGGLSLTQIAKPYVDYWLRTRNAVGDLIQSFVVWQLKTNLAESLMVGGNELFARVDAFTRFMTNRGIILTDKDTEEFANTTAPLSGLEQLQAQSQEHMASIVRIPLVKLLGIQPAGLNASSEGEIRVFYDTILEMQTKFFQPNLQKIIHFIMLGLWGEIDPEITWAWEPLWALDEKQQAEVDEIRARTGQILTETGIVSQEEERKRVAEASESPYQGLDWQEAPDLKEEQAEGLPQPKGAAGGGGLGGGGGGGETRDGGSPAEGEARGGFSRDADIAATIDVALSGMTEEPEELQEAAE